MARRLAQFLWLRVHRWTRRAPSGAPHALSNEHMLLAAFVQHRAALFVRRMAGPSAKLLAGSRSRPGRSPDAARVPACEPARRGRTPSRLRNASRERPFRRTRWMQDNSAFVRGDNSHVTSALCQLQTSSPGPFHWVRRIPGNRSELSRIGPHRLPLMLIEAWVRESYGANRETRTANCPPEDHESDPQVDTWTLANSKLLRLNLMTATTRYKRQQGQVPQRTYCKQEHAETDCQNNKLGCYWSLRGSFL